MINHETFTEIYKRYATLILRTVVAQTKNEELAKEICQQTFMAYYSNLDTVEPGTEKQWLLRTAKNLVIDYWRKASTRKEVPTEDDSGEFLYTATSENLEDDCIDRMFVSEIMEDLKRENKLWYDVIDVLFIREMDRKEAAKHLGISPGMLRARLYRAKQYLKKKYGDEYRRD